ncbi:hypothetical protein [Desulfomonile tiedjei]|uniref:Uncharacterized protein n=1 Tax=Desulfomonile tiedjei (strain ATCC 49306 / DSM 6799 / DCB-1) TaxID=706587 RepID=I4C037_DESTA|nr:hypothetical protein [Desulfomonile tiedjei]AFM22928.1 hypothetical protein Desti_0182 [Desulfomonile tiedjei DSM 6799]
MDYLKILAGVIIALFVIIPIGFALVGMFARIWHYIKNRKST